MHRDSRKVPWPAGAILSGVFLPVAVAQECTPGWTAVGGDMSSSVLSLLPLDDGSGPALYAAGRFGLAGGIPTGPVARWDGFAWSEMGLQFNSTVWVLAYLDDGSGPALYAGGNFHTTGTSTLHGIARWEAGGWATVGDGLRSGGGVQALALYDDGGGPALYAGGLFAIPAYGNSVPQNIAKWDGTAWAPVGSGIDWTVYGLAAFEEGGERVLFVGGTFTSAGGTPARGMAIWNGTTWRDASGAWDQFETLRLVEYDDGTGPGLYAATTAWLATTPYRGVLRRSGGQWIPIGIAEGGGVLSLTVWDDGSGPALLAGGIFTTMNQVPGSRVARWDGNEWSAVGSLNVTGSISAMAGFSQDPFGPALYIGGYFSGPGMDRHIARYHTCPPTCYPNCDGSSVEPILTVDDFTCFINEFAIALGLPYEQQIEQYANCDGSTTVPVLTVDDFTCFINAFSAGCP